MAPVWKFAAPNCCNLYRRLSSYRSLPGSDVVIQQPPTDTNNFSEPPQSHPGAAKLATFDLHVCPSSLVLVRRCPDLARGLPPLAVV